MKCVKTWNVCQSDPSLWVNNHVCPLLVFLIEWISVVMIIIIKITTIRGISATSHMHLAAIRCAASCAINLQNKTQCADHISQPFMSLPVVPSYCRSKTAKGMHCWFFSWTRTASSLKWKTTRCSALPHLGGKLEVCCYLYTVCSSQDPLISVKWPCA